MFYPKSKKRSNFREANKIWSRIVLPMILSVLHCYSPTFFRFAIAALSEQTTDTKGFFYVSSVTILSSSSLPVTGMRCEMKLNWTAGIQMKWRCDHHSCNRNINLSNCKIGNSEAMGSNPVRWSPLKIFFGLKFAIA